MKGKKDAVTNLAALLQQQAGNQSNQPVSIPASGKPSKGEMVTGANGELIQLGLNRVSNKRK